jgi:hypothetical protein
MRTGWCLGTDTSKGHSGGSPISDRDAPLITTGGALEPSLQKGILGEVRSWTGTPPDENRGCLGTYPSKGHYGGSPISDRDAP